PVADKLIVATALVLLVSDPRVQERVLFLLPFVASVAVIIGREIVISALREWMAEVGKRASVAVGMLGKVKTTLQMIAISLLLYSKPLWGLPVFRTGELLLYLAALLTLWSMVEYLRAAGRVLRETPEKETDSER
ncbi:MAG: CDP-alcohol phosphatidyltransferase family protein, partial [Pseudomonadota bacterium]|nr:CDP-alcohol phosphatidyltransferase family protein [Pseudomonadota bacterium]